MAESTPVQTDLVVKSSNLSELAKKGMGLYLSNGGINTRNIL